MRDEMAADLPAVMEALGEPVTKGHGNAETLREYWAHQAHPGPTHFQFPIAIEWGTPGGLHAVRRAGERARPHDR